MRAGGWVPRVRELSGERHPPQSARPPPATRKPVIQRRRQRDSGGVAHQVAPQKGETQHQPAQPRLPHRVALGAWYNWLSAMVSEMIAVTTLAQLDTDNHVAVFVPSRILSR